MPLISCRNKHSPRIAGVPARRLVLPKLDAAALACWAFASLLLLAGSAYAGSREIEQAFVSPAELAERQCSICHGPGGQGANPGFPKLAGQNVDYLVKQIRYFKTGIRHGTMMLVQLRNLEEQEVPALARYFSSQRLIPAKLHDTALEAAGRSIYERGIVAAGIAPCAGCHGPRARGSQDIPRLAGQHAEYIGAQLVRFTDNSRSAGQSGRHPVAMDLEDDEIRAVSYFLSGQE